MTVRPLRSRPWIIPVLLLVALIGWAVHTAYGYYQKALGIQWEGLAVSWQGLDLERIELHQQPVEGSPELHLQLHKLHLDWPQLFQLPNVTVKEVQLNYQGSASTPNPEPQGLPDPSLALHWLPYLPDHVDIAHIALRLPCPSGMCQEQGSLSWSKAENQAQLNLKLLHQKHQIEAQLELRPNAAPNQHQANLQVMLDQQVRLKSQQALQEQEDGIWQWSGELSMTELPESHWVLEWLNPWLSYEPARLPESPPKMQLDAHWKLHKPTPQEPLQGEVQTNIHLPAFWPIPSLGMVQGNLELSLTRTGSGWTPSQLNTDLSLQPDPDLVAQLPQHIHPGHLRLKASTHAQVDAITGELPIQLSLASQGNVRLNLQIPKAQLGVHPLRFDFQQARLELGIPRLHLKSGQKLQQLSLQGYFDGALKPEHIWLKQNQKAKLSLGHYQDSAIEGLQVDQLLLELAQLELESPLPLASAQQLRIKEPVQMQLSVGQLQHPQLRPLQWSWKGVLEQKAQAMLLNGTLENSAKLSLTGSLEHQLNGPLSAQFHTPQLQFSQGNPFKDSLTAWPSGLIFDQGKLKLTGHLNRSAQGFVESTLQVQAQNINGLFERTEVQQLNLMAELEQQGNHWAINLEHLDLQQANLGAPLGPLKLYGRYQSTLDAPKRGILSWKTARLEAFGGQFWVDPGYLDLGSHHQYLNVYLRGLNLERLLSAYPAPNLQGNGLIDGHFALHPTPEGLYINQGMLIARAPGVLQLQSPELHNLGQANPAMLLVTQALENFHYQRLSSDIQYFPTGILKLGLQLQGQNPKLQDGRPIHFNVNLEENLPALLTSLQLSDRVSERLQQHVQQQLERPTGVTQP